MKPGEGGEELGDIWLLDTTRQALAWACVALPATLPSGPRPLQRCHAATRLGSSILFFGGGRSHTLTNGVSRFDTEAMAWAAPPALSGPPPCRRQNAAMELLPSTGAVVAVVGGWEPSANLPRTFREPSRRRRRLWRVEDGRDGARRAPRRHVRARPRRAAACRRGAQSRRSGGGGGRRERERRERERRAAL
mmetsp:Transcript_33590/g.100348  ORF Transcript_33590/g.100348 Transcript_33590/m.100348 type:complete len:192 (+) Transcript_33590:1139-1714(+)